MQSIGLLRRRVAALSNAVVLAMLCACVMTNSSDVEEIDDDASVGLVTAELGAEDLVWYDPAHVTKFMKSYGNNTWSTSQMDAEDAETAYRVLVHNTYGIKHGEITVSSPVRGWSKENCNETHLRLSARAWVMQNDIWVGVHKVDVKPQWLVYGGEFPGQFCSLSTSFKFLPSATQVRVLAEAMRLAPTINPRVRPSFIPMNATVSGSGYREPPPPTLSITEVTRTGEANLLQMTMKYDGFGTRIGFSIKGTYKYCAVDACTLNSANYCSGRFCPPGILPSGSHTYPLPQPKHCDFYQGAAPKEFIDTERSYHWPKPKLAPDSADCPPCTNDGRCADLLVEATVSSPDEFWEYDHEHLQVWGVVIQ